MLSTTGTHAEVQAKVPPNDSETGQEDIIPYGEMSMSDVIKMVSGMLKEVVEINDKLPFNEQKLTRFHSRVPAGISIKSYISRIVRFCGVDPVILVVLVYFTDLLSRSYENFVLNSLTVHRFIITSVTIASKGLCDSFCTNAHYAKVGGLQQMELNLLESEFLSRVSYKIVPNYQVMTQFYQSMYLRHGPNANDNISDTSSMPGQQSPVIAVGTNPSTAQNQASYTSPPHAQDHEFRRSDTQGSSSQEKDTRTKLSRAMDKMFHPMKKRTSEGNTGLQTKRPKQ